MFYFVFFFFFKQKTAYEMRISDWSSDVCSSDLSSPSRPSGSEAEMERQDPILGRGWSFPMTTESRGPILVGGAEKVEQSLRLILFTTPGERVLQIGRASCRERVCQYV